MDAIDTTTNAKGAFLSLNVPAWHGLGEVVADLPMSKIVNHRGMNYRVVLETLTTASGKQVPGQFATVRTDTMAPLDVVGATYNVVQHVDEFKLFDEILTKNKYRYETAGVLHGGSEVFLLARRPESLFIVPGDEIKEYMLFRFSYEWGKAARAKAVNQRVVCANTLALAFKEKAAATDIRIRHTANAQDKLAEFRESLDLVAQAHRQFEPEAKQLLNKDFNKQLLKEAMATVITTVHPVVPTEAKALIAFKKKIGLTMASIREKLDEPNQNIAGISGTRWSLFNAMSEFADHTYAKGKFGTERVKAENRFQSAIDGRAQALKSEVWQQLLAA